jgi:hypothetical protein
MSFCHFLTTQIILTKTLKNAEGGKLLFSSQQQQQLQQQQQQQQQHDILIHI